MKCGSTMFNLLLELGMEKNTGMELRRPGGMMLYWQAWDWSKQHRSDQTWDWSNQTWDWSKDWSKQTWDWPNQTWDAYGGDWSKHQSNGEEAAAAAQSWDDASAWRGDWSWDSAQDWDWQDDNEGSQDEAWAKDWSEEIWHQHRNKRVRGHDSPAINGQWYAYFGSRRCFERMVRNKFRKRAGVKTPSGWSW